MTPAATSTDRHWPEFDFAETELAGSNLIEAAAGTGKTYNIAGLFLRLLIERRWGVRDILVVTFTEAATEELRDRVRRLLRNAVASLDGAEPERQVARLLAGVPDDQRAGLRRHLHLELCDFDDAAIFTIHGFCRRMLHDQAFESGIPFDIELLKDNTAIVQEIVDDYWRRKLYTANAELVSHLLDRKISPASLFEDARRCLRHPGMQILPATEFVVPKQTLAAQRATFRLMQQQWPTARREISYLLSHAPLNRTRYWPERIERVLADLDLRFKTPAGLSRPVQDLDLLTTAELTSGTNLGGQPPKHPFFELCDEFVARSQQLTAELRACELAIRASLCRQVQKEIEPRTSSLHVQTFDDMLVQLRRALDGKDGERLLAAVRGRFKAALVDEFQDTDPLQFEIFMRLFRTPEHMLFLIGDPKQAIYSFRGADVMAYLQAAEQVDRRFTLTCNYRSESGLITGMNALFGRSPTPFIYPQIPFHTATAGGPADASPLTCKGRRQSDPLHLWYLDLPTEGPYSPTHAQTVIPRRVATAIASMLSSEATIGEHPVTPGNIAVLVRSHWQAEAIKQALDARQIPAVLHTRETIFRTREMQDIERILAAVLDPADDRALRAALTTDLIWTPLTRIEQLARDEDAWDRLLADFRGYHDHWRQYGFMPMFNTLLVEHKVRERLLSTPDGERRLTNVRHAAEVLHAAAVAENLGMAGLLKWAAGRRQDGSSADEHQLRLETDDQAVTIATIHHSKGLEYDIVYCPYSFSPLRKDPDKPPLVYHDASALTLDFRSPPDEGCVHRTIEELIAEDLRLLYVALTRAKHRCHLLWGHFRFKTPSALAWLLHPPPPGVAPHDVTAHYHRLSRGEVVGQLLQLQQEAANCIRVRKLTDVKAPVYVAPATDPGGLQPRQFNRVLRHDWRITSFSALVSNKPSRAETPDRDEADLPLTPAETPEAIPQKYLPTGVAAFPAGARPGLLLHELFEELDFAAGDSDAIRDLAGRKLVRYGLDAGRWQETIAQMVERVLAAPLPGVDGPVTLRQVTMAQRLTELSFHLPLRSLSKPDLAAVFARHRVPGVSGFAERLEQLTFAPTHGYMKGFIDLIFTQRGRWYVVDWKSNLLGPDTDSYDVDALAREMRDSYYLLQYHLYVVALHQHLSRCLPGYDYETHFGGVFYLFLRGIDPRQPHYGVFADRPTFALVEALRQVLLPEAAHV